MTPFLQQVAAHYYGAPDLEKTCFIFPNRRSLVFFRHYLGREVAASGRGIPLQSPPLFPINDFFARCYQGTVSVKLRLMVELYRCYAEIYPQAESLDDFMFWGDTLLADFDDLDKYLVDAAQLLQNVAAYKGMQDDFSYLSDTQRKAVEQFLSHFKGPEESVVKSRFVRLWNLLLPLYRSFRASLEEKGMAYEGMMYRHLAERIRGGESVRDILQAAFPEAESFVFVGLNALTPCESLLMKRMRDAGVARFVWDFSSAEIRDKRNKSSLYMERNLADFPQDFPIDPEGLSRPQVSVISVPSAVGQAKLAPQLLAQIPAAPMETAFVLPDESLLVPLLHSLPPQQEAVNVTMGYPLSGSAVYAVLKALSQLQLQMRRHGDRWYFYHRSVREVFSCSLFRQVLTPEETETVRRVTAEAKYYIPPEDLRGGPALELFFSPVVTAPEAASAEANHALGAWLAEVTAWMGRAISAAPEMILELDFAKRCHTELTLLQEIDLEVKPSTWFSTLDRLLQGISVPFRGEPLQGLQVMGPLETRALDFRHVIILSANEGSFPRKSLRVSFIPPQLRKGFGLPTYEYQDAVWAYYFYRLLQRAEHVWLIYDSRTEGVKSGEESRYIKQLEYYFHWKPDKKVAAAPMLAIPVESEIPKTEEAVQAIREARLSASALKNYLYCPAKFYYQVVERLAVPEEVAESLDSRMIGNVFHHVMETLYKGKELITREYLDKLRKDKGRLKALIRRFVQEEMRSVEVSGRNLVIEEVLLDYIQGTLRQDATLLAREGAPGIRILGLEKKYELTLFGGFHFKGYIDRMDSYRDGEVRIIDYKTGKVDDKDLLITDDNAAEVAEKVFGPIGASWPKTALQLFIYDQFAHADPALQGQRLVNAIYSTARLYSTPLPDTPESLAFSRIMTEKVSALLQEITDLSLPFRRTERRETCQLCDFKAICGR